MLIGHSNLLEQFRDKIRKKSLGHANLFLGPAHIGKTRFALELGLILQELEQDQVGRKHWLEGMDTDGIFYFNNGENLPIEALRDLLKRCHQSHNKKYLIVLVEELKRLSVEGQNTLLKILEEPLPGTIFFLTATNENEVLDTIRSRCQTSRFSPVTTHEMRAACESHVYIEEIIKFSMGRPGIMHKLLKDTEYFEAHRRMYHELLQFFENPKSGKAFALSRTYEKDPLRNEWLDILLITARNLALAQHIPSHLAHLDFGEILSAIEDAKIDLRDNVNAKAVLENLLLRFTP